MGRGRLGSRDFSFACSTREEEGEKAADSIEATHLADERKKSLLMMQQGFALSSVKLKWKPQLKASSNVLALAKARGRPRSCDFCWTSARIHMETTLAQPW